jgi:hypothetical protein
MNPFARLIECCCVEKEFAGATFSISQQAEVYGVGIGFQQDKLGALIVARITPAGTNEQA